MVIILDTSAWIEYFKNTEKATLIEDVLKTRKSFTSIITFTEIVNWCLKNNLKHRINDYLDGIKKISAILEINKNIAIYAGRISYGMKKINKKIGIADSIIIATSLQNELKILTKDQDFKDLPNVELL